jgi:HD superfamily phosphohydrolase YqeK
MTGKETHPIIEAAAQGQLPDWTCVKDSRMPHLASVAEVMLTWATDLELDLSDRQRWTAAGWLHDSLRDADPESFGAEVDEFPAKVRHGPAAAERLRQAGVDDEEVLQAITFHSLGCGGMERLGRYLYLADYLEPLRKFDRVEREALMGHLPHDPAKALRSVCARRIAYQVGRGTALRRETVEFWNEFVGIR